jgi:hypothetical protein
MEREYQKETRKAVFIIVFILIIASLTSFSGCSGYSNQSLYPEDVHSVYVEMFDNKSFWRGVEYQLTDALAKRIETETPYKIVSSRDRADTIISGQLVTVDEQRLSTERETGRPLEKEVQLQAVVNWKNLKTGELLIDSKTVSASASFSEWQEQGFRYGSTAAANNLAQRIVELMEKQW